VGDYQWVSPVGTLKTCFMQLSTSINSVQAIFFPIKDESMFALTFWGNENIFFLPRKVNEKFPNLSTYNAGSTSIKQILQHDFIGLIKLRVLFLHFNQIEIIESTTFEGLNALEIIWLRKKKKLLLKMNDIKFYFLEQNQIKFMNGAVFQTLNQLQQVLLHTNPCINLNFGNQSQISSMSVIVTTYCGFYEPNFNYSNEQAQITIVQLSNQIKLLELQLDSSKISSNKTMKENEELRLNVLELKSEVNTSKLDCKVERQQYQKTLHFIQEQWNATIFSKINEFHKSFDEKSKENDENLLELQKLKSEMNNKSAEIKRLKDKIYEMLFK
jgi:hypothetical protein